MVQQVQASKSVWFQVSRNIQRWDLIPWGAWCFWHFRVFVNPSLLTMLLGAVFWTSGTFLEFPGGFYPFWGLPRWWGFTWFLLWLIFTLKKSLGRWLRKQWELTSLRQVQHFKMMAMADVRHLLESAWEALGKGFLKAETVRVTLDGPQFWIWNAETPLLLLISRFVASAFFLEIHQRQSSWDSARKPCISMRITRRSQIEKTWSTDLQVNHPSYPPKPTEYGIVQHKKLRLGHILLYLLDIVYTSFVDDTSFSKRL